MPITTHIKLKTIKEVNTENISARLIKKLMI